MKVKEKIFFIFKTKKELSIIDIVDELSVSRQFVHRILNEFLETGIIEKFGKSPKTIYKLKEIATEKSTISTLIEPSTIDFLNQNFLMITKIRNLLSGIDAFENWCIKRNLPLEKTISEYIETKNRYDNYYDTNHLISGLDKLKNTKG